MPRLAPGAPTDAWAREFNDWLNRVVTRGDRESLVNYRTIAPFAREAHPYPDHYMPLLAVFGAAGPGARGTGSSPRLGHGRPWDGSIRVQMIIYV